MASDLDRTPLDRLAEACLGRLKARPPDARLMAHRREVYRALLDFVGLPWDAACLRFHETRRDVGTAGYDPVRRPIYNTSIGRWKRYERHLGPLREALAHDPIDPIDPTG